jgi:phosphatidylinositol alpha-mannosyltransferase
VKVAVVHPYSWPSVRRGGERYVHDLTWWLARRGHDVSLVTGAGEVDADDGVRVVGLRRRDGVRLKRYGVSALDTFGATALPHLLAERYDVVHSMIPSGAVAGAAALTPSVWTVLGHPSPTNPPVWWWSRQLLHRAARSARVVTALSSSAAEGVEAFTGTRAVVVPPGLRADAFPLPVAGRDAGPVLLFPAFASDPRKRLSVLLGAVPLLLPRYPDLVVRLVGGGDPTEELARLSPADRDLVLPRLQDLGAVADLPDHYARASAVVLPSVEEAFGLVLVESMSCGTPVVCTSSGGSAEIVTPDTGAVAAPDDVSSLAAAVERALGLAADPATRARCSARSRAWVWDLVGPLHESVYGLARG